MTHIKLIEAIIIETTPQTSFAFLIPLFNILFVLFVSHVLPCFSCLLLFSRFIFGLIWMVVVKFCHTSGRRNWKYAEANWKDKCLNIHYRLLLTCAQILWYTFFLGLQSTCKVYTHKFCGKLHSYEHDSEAQTAKKNMIRIVVIYIERMCGWDEYFSTIDYVVNATHCGFFEFTDGIFHGIFHFIHFRF